MHSHTCSVASSGRPVQPCTPAPPLQAKLHDLQALVRQLLAERRPVTPSHSTQHHLYTSTQNTVHTSSQNTVHTSAQNTIHTGTQDTIHTGTQAAFHTSIPLHLRPQVEALAIYCPPTVLLLLPSPLLLCLPSPLLLSPPPLYCCLPLRVCSPLLLYLLPSTAVSPSPLLLSPPPPLYCCLPLPSTAVSPPLYCCLPLLAGIQQCSPRGTRAVRLPLREGERTGGER